MLLSTKYDDVKKIYIGSLSYFFMDGFFSWGSSRDFRQSFRMEILADIFKVLNEISDSVIDSLREEDFSNTEHPLTDIRDIMSSVIMHSILPPILDRQDDDNVEKYIKGTKEVKGARKSEQYDLLRKHLTSYFYIPFAECLYLCTLSHALMQTRGVSLHLKKVLARGMRLPPTIFWEETGYIHIVHGEKDFPSNYYPPILSGTVAGKESFEDKCPGRDEEGMVSFKLLLAFTQKVCDEVVLLLYQQYKGIQVKKSTSLEWRLILSKITVQVNQNSPFLRSDNP